MRELKPNLVTYQNVALRRTPPGVRELKLPSSGLRGFASRSRTPPGVRELKPEYRQAMSDRIGRTPPGVRELKRI